MPNKKRRVWYVCVRGRDVCVWERTRCVCERTRCVCEGKRCVCVRERGRDVWDMCVWEEEMCVCVRGRDAKHTHTHFFIPTLQTKTCQTKNPPGEGGLIIRSNCIVWCSVLSSRVVCRTIGHMWSLQHTATHCNTLQHTATSVWQTTDTNDTCVLYSVLQCPLL